MATDARDRKLASQAGAAVLSLPGFHFTDDSFGEAPTDLLMTCRELRNLRARVLLAAGETFQPDVFLLDTNPHGKRDEVLPLLRYLRRRGKTRILLMMRDIPACAGDNFKLAGEEGRMRKHAALYDRLLLAGDAGFFDTPAELGWGESIRAKARFLGFVVPSEGRGLSRREAFGAIPSLDPELPLLTASFGGGWEADRLGPALVDAFLARRDSGASPPVQLLLAAGPALSEESLARLRGRVAERRGIVVERFVPGFADVLAHCDAAILQAGSTVFQILESDVPVVLLCREYRDPEQKERAERLKAWPGIRIVPPDFITESNAAGWIDWAVSQPRILRRTGFSFQGVANAADEVMNALGGGGRN